MTYSVVIADDHLLVRKSIRQLLDVHESFDVLGEAGDGIETIALVKSLKPNLLILDAAMPNATGVEAIEEVRRWSPQTKIAVITGVSSANLLQHVIESGVEGLFLKSEDIDTWAQDLEDICAGGRRISQDAQDRLDVRTQETSLTGRERQVLFGIARGESNAIIAERLGISPNTIDKHRTSIMRKLNVHSATRLVAQAYRDGLMDDADVE